MQAIEQLLRVIKQLRDPHSGCEWDRVQTFDSIKGHTLEESYEVVSAIEQQNFTELKTELGDLLFQILLYAEMADEQHYFNFADICLALKQKLISRHPHIFSASQPAKIGWEVLKQQERDQKQQFSLLDDIPSALPALMRAEKIQKRCASVGFDWHSLAPVLAKVQEELAEVVVELNQTPPVATKVEEEVGDLLFALVNLTRHLGLKAELILNKANQKFERRFRQIERHFKTQGRKLSDASLAEMEQAWQAVKALESSIN